MTADSPAPGRVLRGLAAAVLFVVLSVVWVEDYFPPLPSPLILTLELGPGRPGQSDPLLVAGRAGAGDFLVVRFRDETTVDFAYNSWGDPLLVSASTIKIPADRRLRLQIESPALGQIENRFTTASTRLRVDCEGVTLLEATPHFFPRRAGEIFAGENPLGGTVSGATLHGRLLREDGRELRGGAAQFFSRGDRLAGWLRYNRWQPLALLLLSVATVHLAFRIARLGPPALASAFTSASRAIARHRWFAGLLVLSAVAFAGLVTQGSFQFDVREPFGDFYDYQAMSLLQGRLDVPEEAVGGEAFVAGGKLYGYFGPTPALLRIPFVIFDVAFGRLARGFMLAYFVGALVASYLILRHTTKLLGGSDAAPSPWAVVLFLGGAGLGSSLFFLGSRAYTYHEAILCGAMFALFSCWCALRHLAAPAGRWWLGALACGLLSLHARPPTGLFALTFLGGVAVAIFLRDRRAGLRRPVLLAIASTVAVLTFNGLAYLKFKTFDGAPLRLSRPYDAARLAKIDGRSFHLSNLPFNSYTYLVRPNFRVERHFPWLYLGSGVPGHFFPAAKTDLADETLAFPCAMPGFFALATIACAWAFARRPAARRSAAIIWLAAAPMTLAMFAAVATAERYTADFCPFLICAAALGLAALDSAAPRWRAAGLGALGATTLWACLLGAAMALHYQRDSAWGVPEDVRANYQEMQRRVDAFFGTAHR